MKRVKEYFEYYMNSNEEKMLKKYQAIIQKEFALDWQYAKPKLRFSVARKAIAEFTAFMPSPEMLADLMLTFSEEDCEFTYNCDGSMSEQVYDSTYDFKAVFVFIHMGLGWVWIRT